jgi:phosphatidylglycerophosphate synthase
MVINRWQLPEAPLRASVASATTLGVAGAIGLAVTAHAGLQLDEWYPVKAAIAFIAVMLVAAGFLQSGHPFTRFGPANHVTTARAMLVALVVGLVGESAAAAAAAAALSIAVAGLDGVDGWLARRSRMASEFGARFDMEIDALLIMTLAILAWRYQKAGSWVLASGLIRYLFVAAGWRWPWMEAALPPRSRRKIICVVQTGGLLVIILPFVTPPVSTVAAAVALGALCWSFLLDIRWLWLHAPSTAVA